MGRGYLGAFLWEGESYCGKGKGCPSTPIQGQPHLHGDCFYIDATFNVKNLVKKIIHIIGSRMSFWACHENRNPQESTHKLLGATVGERPKRGKIYVTVIK